ncbi:uncharacterized protein LOC126899214 isoform X2 [Daktulosphaira vitifoliae]|uniref:uncharacterized protein LOC126899214 isoform X2 n=1 Tax=Daktulosphaira vitifoliae TaxID=58002 RepID=UPI0021AAF580|nr:uncharacterized protein LOC126899214 isoform X2 [Daktulosphaira vitifoliae]
MNLKSYSSIIFILLYLLLISANHCSISDYKSYLFKVAKHIIFHNRLQEEWNSIKNISLNYDSNEKLEIIFNYEFNDYNFTSIFDRVLDLINHRYAKYLYTFKNLSIKIIDFCENKYNKKSYGLFIECIKSIQDVIKNSKIMFGTLYEVMNFIENLEIKRVFPKYIGQRTVVNEIKEVYFYTLSTTLPDHSIYKKTNGELDIDEAYNFLMVYNQYVQKDCLTKYNEEYMFLQFNDKNVYDFILDKCIKLFTEANKRENEAYGFRLLLIPIEPGLVLPLLVSEEYCISKLNQLFTNFNFEQYDNINLILENGTKKNARILFQDKVNTSNLKQKKKYLEQLLRCRYVEILKNYYVILSMINDSCKSVRFRSLINQFVECVNELRNSIYLSLNMVQSLLFVLAKLKKISICEISKDLNSLIRVDRILTKYLYDIKVYNYNECDNKSKLNEEEAISVFERIKESQLIIKKRLEFEYRYCTTNICEFISKLPTKQSLKSSIYEKRNSFNKELPIFHFICEYMNTFCKNIIKTDYENTNYKNLI